MPTAKSKFITKRLVLFLLPALVTLSGGWMSIYYLSLQFERDACVRYNEKQFEHARAVSHSTSEILKLIQKDLEYVASLQQMQDAEGEDALPLLTAIYNRLEGYIADVARIDAEGRLIASYKSRPKAPGTDLYRDPSAMKALQTMRSSLAGPFVTDRNVKAIALDVPVFRLDSNGNRIFRGIVSALIQIDNLVKTHITPYDVHLGSFTWILNGDRRIAAHSNYELIGRRWDEIAEASIVATNLGAVDRSRDREFLDKIFSDDKGVMQAQLGSLGAQEQLIAYASMTVADARWVVVSNTPRKAVLRSFEENMSAFRALAGFFGGLLVLIMVFAVYVEQNKLSMERDLRRKLQQSERKYRSFIESSGEGIMLISPDGFIKLVNKKLTEMSGYAEEELLARNMLDLIHPDQNAIVEKKRLECANGESALFEAEVLTKSREPMDVIFSLSPVFNQNEHIGNLAVITDVADKKRVEQEIKQQNKELLRLYEAEQRRVMRLGIIQKAGDKTSSLLELNELLPALAELIRDTFKYYNVNLFLYDKQNDELIFTAGCGGYQSPEPIGLRIKTSHGIVGACFVSSKPVLASDVLKDPNYYAVENLPFTKSELSVPISSRDEIIGVLDAQSSSINAFDEEDVITLQVLAEQIGLAVESARLYEKLKQSLEEVRKSQAFFAKIVLESPLSTFVTDSKGTCILLNQSALALLGREAFYDEVIGKYNMLCDPPFSSSPIAQQIRSALAGEFVQVTVSLPASTGDAAHKDAVALRATLFPLTDESDRVANLVAMFEDLTERMRLEHALQQAQKMESIGTLAGGIAHDFNNILGGVLGYTSLIKTKISAKDPLYQYIDIIETSAWRASELTQQLLAFARGGKYRVQPLNLNKVVREAVHIIASTFGNEIAVTLRLADDLPTVEGDGSQIIQTIVNICINARDAMPHGGELAIASSATEIAERFLNTHPGSKAGRYVLLTFADTGLGMSEETSRRIFEPFFTTKKDQKGTGLGLAMVYGIIKNHGGYIDVESEPGRGTTFSVYLPVSDKNAQDSFPIAGKNEKRGSETILVAEDEEVLRELIAEMLDSDGYKVILTENGLEAIDVYKQLVAEIDLVILDMMMPKLSGREAFRQMKKINPSVKALLSSGYSQDGQPQDMINEGVLGFIQKPYSVNELLNKIRQIIDQN